MVEDVGVVGRPQPSEEGSDPTQVGEESEDQMTTAASKEGSGASEDKAPSGANWNGLQLAKEANPDDNDEDDDDEDDEEDDLEDLCKEEQLLEQILRLRFGDDESGASAGLDFSTFGMSGASGSALGLGAAGSASAASLGSTILSHLPKQRLKLFQPKSKLEQIEDILIESQLLEAYTANGSASFFNLDLPNDLSDDDRELEKTLFCVNGGTSLDFDALEAIFEESDALTEEGSDPSQPCQCSVCSERVAFETEQRQQVHLLRQCWAELRDIVRCVYRFVLDGGGSADRAQIAAAKEKVHRLCVRDAHQLFQRMESAVKEFVLEIKRRLIELIHKQAKDPSLAQDFIEELLNSYERLCSAASQFSPALVDLDIEHLEQFSLSWELFNKHLFQSIIYADPLVQNNLPIFISQLRSLYPEKELEEKYTKLVRGYLDFDVEMENVDAMWQTSESKILKYIQQQDRLREKKKMLREDWERFKAQQTSLGSEARDERPIVVEGTDGGKPVSDGNASRCDAPGEKQQSSGSASAILSSVKESSPSASTSANSLPSPINLHMQLFGSLTDSNPEALAKMYPHLYDTLLEDANTIFKDRIPPERLASIFPTILNSEPLKSCLGADSSKIASELSEALSTALSLSADGAKKPASSINLPDTLPSAPAAKSHASVASGTKTTTTATAASGASVPKSKPLAPGSGCKGVHHGHSAHAKELNKLLHQHYCKKGAAAQASKSAKKGKEPSGTAQTSSDTTADGSEEDSNDDDEEEDSCCSSASACTSDSKQCSCCYCEVFGPSGPPMTPVSKKYPEMRDRLRRLLNKKKKQQQVLTKAPVAPQPKPAPVPAVAAPAPAQSKQMPPAPPSQPRPAQTTPAMTNAKATVTNIKAPVTNIKAMPAALPTASLKAPPAPMQQVQQPVKMAPAPVARAPCVDDLLEFIEGGSQCTNEKKKAKKDRQKQQRLAELRQREEEERRRRESEEAERRRLEEAERRALELERQTQKKQKKKAAQKAKKATTSGQGDLPETASSSAPPSADSSLRLEELRLQQMREIQQLHFKHQRELEEEQRKLESVLSGKTKAAPASSSTSASASASASSAAASSGVSAAAAAAMRASGNSGHVRITRTASGGVEFTPVSSVEARAQPQQPQQLASPFASLMPQLDFPLGGHSAGGGYATAKPVMAPSAPAVSKPASASAASASSANQQMVTIKRVLNPTSADSTVTISSCDSSREKLLYTLINGQIHRSKNAPANLIPTAKLLAESQAEVSEEGLNKKQRKKLRRQQQQSGLDEATKESFATRETSAPPRAPLPVNREGRLDLDRLHLPPGISITKIDGPSGERKGFPSKPEHFAPEDQEEQQMFQAPQPQSNLYPSYVTASANGMSSVAGFPSGINNSNVIVVDTSSLKTSEEEMDDEDDDAKRNKSKKKGRPEEEPKAPTPAQSGNLKSGPQVLIKNVNGKVVITPIPDSGSCQPEGKAAHRHDNCSGRPLTNGSDVGAKKSKKTSSKKAAIGENIDEINSIFAPKDIDLDNGDMDDDEREIEAFKRFCFNSVPPQQKAKVNIDVKNIAFRRK